MEKPSIADYLVKLCSLERTVIEAECRDHSVIASVCLFEGYRLPFFDIDLTKKRIFFYRGPKSDGQKCIVSDLVDFVASRGYDTTNFRLYFK